MRVSPFLLVALAAILAGCSAPRPFVRGEGEARLDGETLRTVRVCYNSRLTTPEAVLALAQEECNLRTVTLVGGATIQEQTPRPMAARFLGHDYLACPLFLPARAHFACLPAGPERQPAEERPPPRTQELPEGPEPPPPLPPGLQER